MAALVPDGWEASTLHARKQEPAMTPNRLGGDPLEQIIADALSQLASGAAPPQIERTRIDIKEEPGRRAGDGSVAPGEQHNEEAAVYLAGEMACMANTPGGGAVVVGVADDGIHIGTELDEEWLRHRIWQLTERQLTVAAREAVPAGKRLLVLTVPGAHAPVSFRGKLRWRVGANCVEVDPVAWQAQALRRLGYDWSAEASGHSLRDARPMALELARRYLRERAVPADIELADASDRDLLTRLDVLDAQSRLTNAGSLLFVETPFAGIDYMRRDMAGGDSTQRIESTLPLLEQIWEAERAGLAANRTTHVATGFVHRQVRAIPELAFREAIVNGVTHRDWMAPAPTVVEHTGDELVVTSPGGLIDGVTPDNAITHPAAPRYRHLAQAVAKLRLAERQGTGIDRMVAAMLAIGRPAPVISEVAGPYVRVTLLGGPPDPTFVEFVHALEPAAIAGVDTLLLLEQLCRVGWTDAASAAPHLQREPAEAEEAINRLLGTRLGDSTVVAEVAGVPPGDPVVVRLSDEAAERLAARQSHLQAPAGRDALFIAWAEARGRISSTEAADLAGVSPGYAKRRLADLADRGDLRPSRHNRNGRGFHYLPAD